REPQTNTERTQHPDPDDYQTTISARTGRHLEPRWLCAALYPSSRPRCLADGQPWGHGLDPRVNVTQLFHWMTLDTSHQVEALRQVLAPVFTRPLANGV